ncbi:hypothetical protein [Radiobacillus deserti]|uniref:hypothetical protein n=1 Tax=Radiobacillus deserti TaxID=2594883 RepID=UPI001E37AD14|nr:hypothetical protein [Radiobacillus deserti]
MKGKAMTIDHPEHRFSFIDSYEAALFLYEIAKLSFEGPINPGSTEDCSLKEMIAMIEKLTEKQAHYSQDGASSPYNFPGPWSVDTSLAQSFGFSFTPLPKLFSSLIDFYKEQS